MKVGRRKGAAPSIERSLFIDIVTKFYMFSVYLLPNSAGDNFVEVAMDIAYGLIAIGWRVVMGTVRASDSAAHRFGNCKAAS